MRNCKINKKTCLRCLHCPHYNVYDAKQGCEKNFDSNSDPTFTQFFGSYSHCNFLNLYNYNSNSDSSFLKTFDSDSVKSKKQLRFQLLPKVQLQLKSCPITLLPTLLTLPILPIHYLYTAYITLPIRNITFSSFLTLCHFSMNNIKII